MESHHAEETVLDQLIESKPPRRATRSIAGGLVSVGVHAILIMLVYQSASGSAPRVSERVDTIMVPLPPVARREPDRAPGQPKMPTLDIAIPDRLPLIPLPTISSELPGIESTRSDPAAYPGHGAAGGMAPLLGSAGSVDPTATFSYAMAEDPPAPLSCPEPRYPRMLKDAGIEGDVLTEVVIDSDGRVDPATIAIVESSHHGFDGAVIEMYRDARCVFRPGRVAGQPVRVLVRQSTAFRIR